MLDIDKFIRKISLKNKQRAVDKQYEEEGLTDDVLEKQIEINRIRYEKDIPDEQEIIYDKYVQ